MTDFDELMKRSTTDWPVAGRGSKLPEREGSAWIYTSAADGQQVLVRYHEGRWQTAAIDPASFDGWEDDPNIPNWFGTFIPTNIVEVMTHGEEKPVGVHFVDTFDRTTLGTPWYTSASQAIHAFGDKTREAQLRGQPKTEEAAFAAYEKIAGPSRDAVQAAVQSAVEYEAQRRMAAEEAKIRGELTGRLRTAISLSLEGHRGVNLAYADHMVATVTDAALGAIVQYARERGSGL